jgi:hypothetical protein
VISFGLTRTDKGRRGVASLAFHGAIVFLG